MAFYNVLLTVLAAFRETDKVLQFFVFQLSPCGEERTWNQCLREEIDTIDEIFLQFHHPGGGFHNHDSISTNNAIRILSEL